jgi:hypothetical protein
MTVPSSMFRLTIEKSWAARSPDRKWSNVYELTTPTPVAPADLAVSGGPIEHIVLAEMALHLDQVAFLQYTLSTWEADSSPYNPDSFVTKELTGNGGRALGTAQPLDERLCLLVTRRVATGKQGRLFYRGVLIETDVIATATLRFKIDDASPVSDVGPGSVWNSYMAMMAMPLNPASTARLALIGIPKGGGSSIERALTGLSVAGVSVDSVNHRYFDRPTVGA